MRMRCDVVRQSQLYADGRDRVEVAVSHDSVAELGWTATAPFSVVLQANGDSYTALIRHHPSEQFYYITAPLYRHEGAARTKFVLPDLLQRLPWYRANGTRKDDRHVFFDVDGSNWTLLTDDTE